MTCISVGSIFAARPARREPSPVINIELSSGHTDIHTASTSKYHTEQIMTVGNAAGSCIARINTKWQRRTWFFAWSCANLNLIKVSRVERTQEMYCILTDTDFKDAPVKTATKIWTGFFRWQLMPKLYPCSTRSLEIFIMIYVEVQGLKSTRNLYIKPYFVECN